jgi:arylsulfatase A-like enzyme
MSSRSPSGDRAGQGTVRRGGVVVNLLMIVIDSLRRDHLGCYGSEVVRTPSIDALAREGTVFDKYYAAGFPTVPARADLALGQWTFTFLPWGPLPPTPPNLAGLLRANGYRTAAVCDTPFLIQDGFHYDRGFEFFIDLGDAQKQGIGSRVVRNGWVHDFGPILRNVRESEYDYPTPRTIATAERCLEELHRFPFFLYVDTWGPHEPWDPPSYYVRQYLADYDGRVVKPPYGDWRAAGLSEDDLETARACYRAEVTLTDRWVGRLLERLESLRVDQETIVVLLTDHGFYFGEHGQLGKLVSAHRTLPTQPDRLDTVTTAPVWLRSPLYEELVHIPLLARVPGAPARRVDHLVSAVDIMPTMLDLLAIPIPGTVQGRSVAGLLRGAEDGGRDMVISSTPLANPGEPVRIVDDQMRLNDEFQPATITTQDWSLIFSVRDDPVELYDLHADPRQAVNVASSHPSVVSDLHRRYIELLESTGTDETYLGPRRALA